MVTDKAPVKSITMVIVLPKTVAAVVYLAKIKPQVHVLSGALSGFPTFLPVQPDGTRRNKHLPTGRAQS